MSLMSSSGVTGSGFSASSVDAFSTDSDSCCTDAFSEPPQTARQLIVYFYELKERIKKAKEPVAVPELEDETTALLKHCEHLECNVLKIHMRLVSAVHSIPANAQGERAPSLPPIGLEPAPSVSVAVLKSTCASLERNIKVSTDDAELSALRFQAQFLKFKTVTIHTEFKAIASEMSTVLGENLHPLKQVWSTQQAAAREELEYLRDRATRKATEFRAAQARARDLRSQLKNLSPASPDYKEVEGEYKVAQTRRNRSEDSMDKADDRKRRYRRTHGKVIDRPSPVTVGAARNPERLAYWTKKVTSAHHEMQEEQGPPAEAEKYPETQESLVTYLSRRS